MDSPKNMSPNNFFPAESFPTEVRGLGCGLCGVLSALSRLIISKLFPLFLGRLGFHGTCWLFSGCAAVVAVYSFLVVPENKGECLTKTEDKLNNTTK